MLAAAARPPGSFGEALFVLVSIPLTFNLMAAFSLARQRWESEGKPGRRRLWLLRGRYALAAPVGLLTGLAFRAVIVALGGAPIWGYFLGIAGAWGYLAVLEAIAAYGELKQMLAQPRPPRVVGSRGIVIPPELLEGRDCPDQATTHDAARSTKHSFRRHGDDLL